MQNNIVEENNDDYSVDKSTLNVIRKYAKKFVFASTPPFKVKEKFHIDSLQREIFEFQVFNQSPYLLFISNTDFCGTKESRDLSILSEEEFTFSYILDYKDTLQYVSLLHRVI